MFALMAFYGVAVAVAVGASISFGSEETWVLLYTTIPHLNLYHYSFPPLSPLLTSLGIFLADTTFPNLSAVYTTINSLQFSLIQKKLMDLYNDLSSDLILKGIIILILG